MAKTKANEVDIIAMALIDELEPSQIASKLGLTEAEVSDYLYNMQRQSAINSICESVSETVFKNKVPVLNAIVGSNLMAIFEWSHEFYKSGEHKNMSIGDANKLMAIVGRFTELARLHEGKSTQNIAVNVRETNESMEELIKKLKKEDEFVDYEDQ